MQNKLDRNPPGELANQSDLKKTLKKFLRNWHIFLISMFVILGLAFLFLRYSTPKYLIKSTILIKDNKKGGGSMGPADAFFDLSLFQTNQNINNEIRVFKGKSLMARVMEELDLNTTYYTEGDVKTIELYGKDTPIKVVPSSLDSSAFGKTIELLLIDNQQFELTDQHGTLKAQFGKLIKRPYGVFTVIASGAEIPVKKIVEVKFHDLYTLGTSYNRKVSITPLDKDASVLDISLEDAVPQKGEDIVTKLIQLYNREAIEDMNQIAKHTVQFIDERLNDLVTDLTAVEMNVENYKKKHNIADVGIEAQSYVQEASGYQRELADYQTQISVLESLQTYLQNSGRDELVPGSMGIQDPALIGLTSKYNELQLEKQRLMRTQKAANPLVKAVDEQINNLRSNITENLNNIKKSLEINVNNLSANTGRYRARVSTVPTIERNLLEIQRQQGIKEALYSYLLQKREEAAISLVSTVANTRIIDPARAGRKPVSPQPMFVYLGSFLFALIFPMFFLSMKESFNEKIQNASDVEKITGVPVLGEIPHSSAKDSLVVKNNSRTEVAEVFRLIRSNIKYAFRDTNKKVFLVTSSMTGEGKTFISVNLGSSFAIPGKKVLLMEFDLRMPKLLKSLGIESDQPGIVDYVADPSIKVQDMMIPVDGVPGLSVIQTGKIPANPSDIMMDDRIKTLFDDLKEQFDYIVIDSSPVGQVADTFSLSELADMVIYVVRYKYTFKQQINIINDIEANDKFNNVMVLMNDAKSHNGYSYGYGYSNGYGYGK